MRYGVLILGFLLAGCASPGHEFWRATARTIEIDGRRYEVFALLDQPRPRVQVIRMGYARRAEHTAILPAMVQAAEQATGCAIQEGSAVGDSGVMNARLRCPDPRARGP
ncbi:MAG: hypothetical protein KDK01_02580 [Rhodobacteraceae bacterium]|jgi:hypothetical protein|nr:hypothetical protein [Paracoccaceae bacterium]